MNNQKIMSGKAKRGQRLTMHLFLLIWIQLLHLTLANKKLGSLTPYGHDQKDEHIQIQEMTFLEVHLDVPFKFTGKMYDTLQVTKNGVITLGDAHPEDPKTLWENIPQSLPLSTAHPLIAAFWTNPQIIQQGNLWFRQTMHVKELENIKHKVECLYPQNKDLVAKWAFIATWENVSSQANSELTNTFQLVLVNIDDYSYALFQYGNLTWNSWKVPTNGTTKSTMHAAVAGYNGGDGISYSMLPGSTSKDILKIQNDSNVDVPDLWVFRVDQSQEPCVQKGLVLLLLLVVLLTLLTGITIGLFISWCIWRWKHKLNEYEDLDAETKKHPLPLTPEPQTPEPQTPEPQTPEPLTPEIEVQESYEEFTFIIEPEESSDTKNIINAGDETRTGVPRGKMILLKKH